MSKATENTDMGGRVGKREEFKGEDEAAKGSQWSGQLGEAFVE